MEGHLSHAFVTERCAGSPRIEKEVLTLLGALDDSRDFMEAPATTEELLLDQHIGPYEIVRQIGKGGMGTVYEALRVGQDFKQRVAIKLVRFGVDSSVVRQRFRAERQILARLSHPNVAGLLDGGSIPDGRPYLVMEYIEGTPLLEYCDSRRLDIAARLGLFRAICGAVQFAHRNLIVHRDIKPANILVTDSGVPKLLDFGIAKIVQPEPDAGLTESGITQAVLTPEYASPEQVRGEAITTATDIYSLGVLLFRLLSGSPPYQTGHRPPHEVAQVICEGEPPKPSSLAPPSLRAQLSGDLDNIILKAMDKNPEKRYASAERFSEDVERHLNGRPVLARPQTLGYRAGKFMRRRKGSLAIASLVFLSLIGALLVTLWEARRAERRFNDVRQLAHALLFDIYDSLQDLSGSTAARKLVVSNALNYLNSLANEATGDRNLQSELASAYERVGDVQGGFRASSLGDPAGALQSYNKALAIRTSLENRGRQVETERALIRTHGKLSDILFQQGKAPESLGHLRNALDIAKNLVTGHPDSQVDRRNLALGYLDYGYKVVQSGAAREGIDSLHSAESTLEDLSRSNPGDKRLRRTLALAYSREGEIANDRLHDYQLSTDAFGKAANLAESLLTSDAHNGDLQRILAYALVGRGSALVSRLKFDDAMPVLTKALALMTNLAQADPKDAQVRFDTGVTQFAIASAYFQRQDWKTARQWFQESLPALHDGRIRGLIGASELATPEQAAARIDECSSHLR